MVHEIAIKDYILENRHRWEERHFVTDTILFYSGHVPFCSFLILEGSGIMISKGRKQENLIKGIPYFHQELLSDRPVKKNVIIKAGSTILMIDRFALMNI